MAYIGDDYQNPYGGDWFDAPAPAPASSGTLTGHPVLHGPIAPPPADYWIPPGASFGDDPSGQINRQNPWADPDRRFVNEGVTGGYIAGKGVTIGEGRSLTPAEYAARRQAALDMGISEAELAEWEARNPLDVHRAPEALRPSGATATGGGSGGGGFLSPEAMRAFTEQFQAPTAESLLNDPSFIGRLQEGSKAIDRAAAAKGTLLTGGTLKGHERFAQDYASREYANVYDRAMNEYLNRANIHYTNEGNRFNSQRALQTDAFGQNLATQQFGLSRDQFDLLRSSTSFDQNRATANDQFNQLFSLSSLMNPSLIANLYSNYGGIGSNSITGAGNAAAAGQIGAGNSWANGLGNLSSIVDSTMRAWLSRLPTTR